MGAAAVPYLSAQLRQKESRWARFYWEKWQGLKPGIKKYLPPPSLPLSFRQERAAMLLGLIGPPAQAAVPDLITAYNNAFLRRLQSSQRPAFGLVTTARQSAEPSIDQFRSLEIPGQNCSSLTILMMRFGSRCAGLWSKSVATTKK